MENKRYVVSVRGMLKFQSGKKIECGNFVPKTTSEEEIEDKLKRKQIVEFDPKAAAAVQGNNKDSSTLHKEIYELNKKILSEQQDNKALKQTIEELETEIESLKKKAKK